jgi:hypothetical protein
MHELKRIDLTKTTAVRLRRSAHALAAVRGPEMLEAVLSMEADIVAAAEQDVPPVSAISEELLRRFGKELKSITVRQFIGTVVKAILADRGFEVAQTGIRLPKDKVFTTGAAYRKAAVAREGDSEDILRRAFANIVRGMDLRERRIMFDELRKALGEN